MNSKIQSSKPVLLEDSDIFGQLLLKPRCLPEPVKSEITSSVSDEAKKTGPDPSKPWLFWAVYTYQPYSWGIHKGELGFDVFHTREEAFQASAKFREKDTYYASGYKVVPAEADPRLKSGFKEIPIENIHEWWVEYYKEEYDEWWQSGYSHETYEKAVKEAENSRDNSSRTMYRVRSRLTGAEYNIGRRKGWNNCHYCRGPCRKLYTGCDPSFIPEPIYVAPCGWC